MRTFLPGVVERFYLVGVKKDRLGGGMGVLGGWFDLTRSRSVWDRGRLGSERAAWAGGGGKERSSNC